MPDVSCGSHLASKSPCKGGSPAALHATQVVHACSHPPFPPQSLAAVVSTSKLNTNPIIAAVPLMVLTLVVLAVGGYTFTQRNMWGYKITGADLAALQALAAKPAAAGRRVGELTFDNVTVRCATAGVCVWLPEEVFGSCCCCG